MYIGFGILLAFTVGGQLGTNPAANLIKGLIFGVALSLVVIPGAELFTGNLVNQDSGSLDSLAVFIDERIVLGADLDGGIVASTLVVKQGFDDSDPVFPVLGLVNLQKRGEFFRMTDFRQYSLDPVQRGGHPCLQAG